MAIEDAVVLANAFKNRVDVETSLRTYEAPDNLAPLRW